MSAITRAEGATHRLITLARQLLEDIEHLPDVSGCDATEAARSSILTWREMGTTLDDHRAALSAATTPEDPTTVRDRLRAAARVSELKAADLPLDDSAHELVEGYALLLYRHVEVALTQAGAAPPDITPAHMLSAAAAISVWKDGSLLIRILTVMWGVRHLVTQEAARARLAVGARWPLAAVIPGTPHVLPANPVPFHLNGGSTHPPSHQLSDGPCEVLTADGRMPALRVNGVEYEFMQSERAAAKLIEAMWGCYPTGRRPVEQVKEEVGSAAGSERWAYNLALKTRHPLARCTLPYHLKADELEVWWVPADLTQEKAD